MSWGAEARTPPIDWTMSAALENVVRGDSDVAEVTNLRAAVAAWTNLDPAHRTAAVLTTERPIMIEGVGSSRFEGEGIRSLVELAG